MENLKEKVEILRSDLIKYKKEKLYLQNNIIKIENNITDIEKEMFKLENKINNIDDNINLLLESDNIWYMNGNYEDLKIWDYIIKNNTLTTWMTFGKKPQNIDIETKLKKGDIIVWYIVSKGYNSIVKVVDEPFMFDIEEDREELSNYYEAWRDKFNTFDNWLNDEKIENYKRVGIKVEFLVTSNTKFIMKPETINWKKKWSYGLQGSNLSKRHNEYWREQVIEIYKYLK
tara:strand:- start:950 stop:1639 length:690 start_codon:yes stop_codon:yes gene_type:complete